MIKRIFLSFSLSLLMLFSMSLPALAVDTQTAIQCGVNQAAGTDCGAAPGNGNLTGLVSRIIGLLSTLVGAVAVIMLIVGGFRYVTSAGNEQAVTAAKKTIVYALVGLVIVAFAQIIVHFVLKNLG